MATFETITWQAFGVLIVMISTIGAAFAWAMKKSFRLGRTEQRVIDIEAAINQDIKPELTQMISEMHSMRLELRQELQETRQELQKDIHALRAETKEDTHALQAEIKENRIEIKNDMQEIRNLLLKKQ